jgi:hypothetical protein
MAMADTAPVVSSAGSTSAPTSRVAAQGAMQVGTVQVLTIIIMARFVSGL